MDYDEFIARGEARRANRYKFPWGEVVGIIVTAWLLVFVIFYITWGVMA